MRLRETRPPYVQIRTSEWRMVHIPSNDQQDGVSCGVFVLMNALCLLQGKAPLSMGQEDVIKYRDMMYRKLTDPSTKGIRKSFIIYEIEQKI